MATYTFPEAIINNPAKLIELTALITGKQFDLHKITVTEEISATQEAEIQNITFFSKEGYTSARIIYSLHYRTSMAYCQRIIQASIEDGVLPNGTTFSSERNLLIVNLPID